DAGMFDVYGWFHLLRNILDVERALNNKEAARGAAHGLFRVAITSGSLRWEVEAACALCIEDPDPTDPEVSMAIARLRAMADDSSKEAKVRVHALVGIVRCEWSLERYEFSVIALLELIALGHEHGVRMPMFGHMMNDGSYTENVLAGP